MTPDPLRANRRRQPGVYTQPRTAALQPLGCWGFSVPLHGGCCLLGLVPRRTDGGAGERGQPGRMGLSAWPGDSTPDSPMGHQGPLQAGSSHKSRTNKQTDRLMDSQARSISGFWACWFSCPLGERMNPMVCCLPWACPPTSPSPRVAGAARIVPRVIWVQVCGKADLCQSGVVAE